MSEIFNYSFLLSCDLCLGVGFSNRVLGVKNIFTLFPLLSLTLATFLSINKLLSTLSFRPDGSPMYSNSYSSSRSDQPHPPTLSSSSSSSHLPSRSVQAEAMAPPPVPAGRRSSLGGGGLARDTLEYDVDFEEMI